MQNDSVNRGQIRAKTTGRGSHQQQSRPANATVMVCTSLLARHACQKPDRAPHNMHYALPSTYHKHLPRDASAASFSGNGTAQPPSQLNHRYGTAGSERLCTVMLPMAMQRAKLQMTSDIKDIAVTGAVHYSSTKNKQAYCCRQAQQLTVSKLLSKVIVPTDILTNK